MMEEPRYHLEGVVRSKAETLEDFNGSLDVILLLLSKNKIEIQDISISSILEQYLAYLDERERLDMEIASEFIAMASYLMLIKTKMLLSISEQQEAMSEMELLIRSLEERQRKEARDQIGFAVSFLAGRNELGVCCLPKQPEPVKRDQTYRYQHDRQDLLDALTLLAERSERLLPPPVSSFQGIVGAEPYPVTKKAAEILKRLLLGGVTRLRQLFQGNRSRSEVVATFLALLELCRQSSIALEDGAGDEQSVSFLKLPEEKEEVPEEVE
ncbi:MAG: segregation/condensation protein A [Oscillospiraceae bacterium]|nr:segregation/condensation protein A [Oscillospiraceae bacterium]